MLSFVLCGICVSCDVVLNLVLCLPLARFVVSCVSSVLRDTCEFSRVRITVTVRITVRVRIRVGVRGDNGNLLGFQSCESLQREREPRKPYCMREKKLEMARQDQTRETRQDKDKRTIPKQRKDKNRVKTKDKRQKDKKTKDIERQKTRNDKRQGKTKDERQGKTRKDKRQYEIDTTVFAPALPNPRVGLWNPPPTYKDPSNENKVQY
jgi:hypothetical protein